MAKLVRTKPLTESQFVELMTKFAKNTRTTVTASRARNGVPRHVLFKSYEGTVDYEEKMPSFNEPKWASWCAFRLLHPTSLYYFECELRDLFEDFKKGKSKWASYNEEKKALLQRYLKQPYEPRRRK